LSRKELEGLHLYVVAHKPDCHDGDDLKAT
jgi:hypothetical protein